MKYLLFFLSAFLFGCSHSPERIIMVPPVPDCQSIQASFQEYAQKSIEDMGGNVWIVDMELFYSPRLKACIGKYMASRKEGRQEDVSIFVVRNMRDREDIYFQKYTGKELKNEYEGQKIYREQVTSLQQI